MKTRLRSFTGVLLAGVLGVHLALIPLSFNLVFSYIQDGFQSQFVDNVRANASLLARALGARDLATEQQAAALWLEELMLTGQVKYAELALADGRVLQPARDTDGAFVEDFYFGQHNDDVYYIAVDLVDPTNGRQGVLRLGFDETLTAEQYLAGYRRGLLATAGLLVLTIAVIVLLVYRMTRPLDRLREAARGIADGNDAQDLHLTSGVEEFRALARDLERMRAELVRRRQEIEGREAYIRGVIENMPNPMVVADAELRIESINPAAEAVFGYAWTELIGRPVSSLFSDAEQGHLAHEFHEAARGGEQPQGHERLGCRRDGSQFPVELNIGRVTINGRGLLIVNIHDISRRKESEQQLVAAHRQAQQASEAKSRFLSIMSHELRTPLNAIIGYSEMLLEEEDAPLAANADLHRIRAAAKHLLALISEILDLSRIEAGKAELHSQFFDVPQLVEEAVATAGPLVERNGNRLSWEIEPGIATMVADYAKVLQLFANVVENAAKFTEDGEIRIKVSQQTSDGIEWITFAVSDSGVGIPIEHIERLFDDFTQVDSSDTRKFGGAGLGLTISRHYCEMMGGRITVESGLGQGSTFRLTLPLDVPAYLASREPQDNLSPDDQASQ